MCLIIDANILAEFFSHTEFKPAVNWVVVGNGKVVMGGSKYKEELDHVKKIRGVILELRKAGRLVEIETERVDDRELNIARNYEIRSDDPHILALVVESCCRVVCTRDRPLQQDFGNRFRERFGVRRPSIYNRARHANLLCARNIVSICR